jgi:nicotinate-nucleotide adenylyltransferase
VHLAVFGGSFDPPHNGHLALCLFARELLSIDRLIISVSNNPFKQTRGASDEQRKRMASLLSSEINLTGNSSTVSLWELEKRQPSYTVDLLLHLRSLYPDDRLTLLVGEDSFREFDSWKDHEKLYTLCDICVFGRAASTGESLPESREGKEGIRFIDFAYPASSTSIRELVASDQSIAQFVPASIARYIAEHSVYR